MPKGGARAGGGRPTVWSLVDGEITAIATLRVPMRLGKPVKAITHKIDKDEVSPDEVLELIEILKTTPIAVLRTAAEHHAMIAR